MKVFAIVLMLMGILVFYIGLKGSQHEVMAMLKGSGANVVASGLSINAAGGGSNTSTTALTNTGGPSNTPPTTGAPVNPPITQQQAGETTL